MDLTDQAGLYRTGISEVTFYCWKYSQIPNSHSTMTVSYLVLLP